MTKVLGTSAQPRDGAHVPAVPYMMQRLIQNSTLTTTHPTQMDQKMSLSTVNRRLQTQNVGQARLSEQTRTKPKMSNNCTNREERNHPNGEQPSREANDAESVTRDNYNKYQHVASNPYSHYINNLINRKAHRTLKVPP